MYESPVSELRVIKSRSTGQVIFSSETAESKRDAALEALSSGADLRGADLHGADLSDAGMHGADLRGADLRGVNFRDALFRNADLRDADLHGADLHGADLYGSNLRCADLSGTDLRLAKLHGTNLRFADLRFADLRDADLRGADLVGANLIDAKLYGANLVGSKLYGANLVRANLSGADLRDADLYAIRDDLWAVLSSAPAEVVGLRNAIAEGRIDGHSYSGDCACLVGTIANIQHCSVYEIPGLKPDSERPAEVFFLAIAPGDTPETSQFSALALAWVDEWLNNQVRRES